MEAWRVLLGNDGLGYGSGGIFNARNHASICSCGRCTDEWMKHQGRKCGCRVCLMQNLNRRLPYKSNSKGDDAMSTINLCDRCESMGKSVAMGIITYMTDSTQPVEHVEVCPGCVEDFMQFLNGDVNMQTRQKAYKEPWQAETDNTETGEIITGKVRAALREIIAAEDDS